MENNKPAKNFHSSSSSSSRFFSLGPNSNSLKRKRPPKIEIPNVLQEIQTDQLKFRDLMSQNDTIHFSGTGVGVFSLKGKKKFMEDTHKIISCLHGNSNKGFFGVYDGHGGRMAAEFVAENLHTNIFDMMKDCRGAKDKEAAVKAAYLKTDQEFLEEGLVSGVCCVTALIDDQEVVVSNLGDCRAVLCRGGVAEALTTDHKAGREDERKRIENTGGYVEIHRGAWRVHGVLSVSRSIGDAHLKSWVLGEPDTTILHLTTDMEFLVLASDGLWEEVGNQEAIDVVSQLLIRKKLESSEDIYNDNSKDYGCVNISPSSKLRRVSLVKQQEEASQPPRYKRNDIWKVGDDDFPSENRSLTSKAACVNISPSSKLHRVSLVKRQKEASQSPRYKRNDIWKDGDDDFPSENGNPTSKSGCINISPSSKLRRVSLVKQQKEVSQSLYKKSDIWKDGDNDSPSENGSPPSNSRRISLVKRLNIRDESPCHENSSYKKSPASVGLMAACKELVNLAASRGSLDDITVMIIDLNHFRCSS